MRGLQLRRVLPVGQKIFDKDRVEGRARNHTVFEIFFFFGKRNSALVVGIRLKYVIFCLTNERL